MSYLKNSRRGFLKIMGGLGAGIFTGFRPGGKIFAAQSNQMASAMRPRPAGAKYMGGFSAPKLETVRCAFIGVGSRGSGHARQLAEIEGTEIVAISDLYEDLAKRSEQRCKESGKGTRHQNIALYYGSEDAWKKMLQEVKPDAVFIATPWPLHTPMGVMAMQNNAHAFIEVPIGQTIEDMWQLVDTSEQTQRHCMMMENVNYGREELMYNNMVKQGVIGELLHGEAAYIHELRNQMRSVDRGTGSWRTYMYANKNGNLYPTHGLGPVAQYMNIARTDDTFSRMVSFSTPAIGRKEYTMKNYPPPHQWSKLVWKGGDMNVSIIKTHVGRTILVEWDETNPRPYSRLNLIMGTKGTLAGFPTRIALEGGVEGATESQHEWAYEDKLGAIYEKYDHPLYKRLGEVAVRMGGHGGMDFIMRYRIIECLREGIPLDQNVYEGCLWSAVSPLSEASVAQDGAPQEFPDFTRGEWKNTKPLTIVS